MERKLVKDYWVHEEVNHEIVIAPSPEDKKARENGLTMLKTVLLLLIQHIGVTSDSPPRYYWKV